MMTRSRKGRKSLTENSHKPKRLKRSHSYSEESKTDSNMQNHQDDIVVPISKTKMLTKRKSDSDMLLDDYTKNLSLEILCKVMKSLPLWDVMKLESLSRKLHEAVSLHLRLLTKLDFVEGEIHGWMPQGFNDTTIMKFLQRCPDLEVVYGFHPRQLAKRKQRGDTLSIPGVIAAFKACGKLRQVETCDIFLLDALLTYMPRIEIARQFSNRNGDFPIPMTNKLTLTRNARITTLNLVGVVIPELPRMDHLQHLQLQWVKLTDPQPFKAFGVPSLETFVMRNCSGPASAVKYVPLITGLAAVRSLKKMELIRVPYLGGLIQHMVEDGWRTQGFRHLQKVTLGACRHALEMDIGYLAITCAHRLRELAMQPSLTKDSLFSSLSMAEVQFPQFETLHLSYVDDFPPHGKWSNEELVSHGLADIVESPAMITDVGMKSVGMVFTHVQSLNIYNCPHLCLPSLWLNDVQHSWAMLRHLHLRRCHAIRLFDFCKVIPQLPNLESLILEQMFREPPKGCSRVGLSAGTGLGVSSALVQNTSNDGGNLNQDIANNNPPANDDDDVEDQNLDVPDDIDDLDDDIDMEPVMVQCEPANLDAQYSDDDSLDGPIGPQASPNVTYYDMRSRDGDNDNENSNNREDSDLDWEEEFDLVPPVRVETDSPASPTGADSGNYQHGNPKPGCSKKSKKKRYKGKGKSLRGSKKGIVKKSKNSQINQSCQATSEDIRETTKKAKESEDSKKSKEKTKDKEDSKRKRKSSERKHKRRSRSSSHSQKQKSHPDEPGPSTSGVANKSKNFNSGGSTVDSASQVTARPNHSHKTNMVDKSTSTSDPVIEEDHKQNLIIGSKTLTNVSLRQVGITDLILYDCPKLTTLSGSACRVLRSVQLKNTPCVRNVSFAQCFKLHHGDLIDEVGLLPGSCNRVVNIRPMGNYNRFEMIRFLYRSVLFSGHLCIIHDYNTDPHLALVNRQRAQSWLDLFSGINQVLIDTRGFRQAYNNYEQLLKNYQYFISGDDGDSVTQKNPSNRNIYTLKGGGEQGHWDLVTDIPWLRSLATAKPLPHKPQPALDKDSGLYCPESMGHDDVSTCLDLLEEEIAEACESRVELYRHVFLVYVTMCDMDAQPKMDNYV